MWARIHLIPLLQAEEDRDQIRRHFADKAREKELLGREIKVYHSDRYVYIISLPFFFFIFRLFYFKSVFWWCWVGLGGVCVWRKGLLYN